MHKSTNPNTLTTLQQDLALRQTKSRMVRQAKGIFTEGLRLFLTATLLALLINTTIPTPIAYAATFTVNTTSDGADNVPNDGVCETGPGNGICTLRAAIEEANANALFSHDIINVPAGTYTLSVVSGTPPDGAIDLDITEDLTIIGAGAGATIIDGGGNDRVFHINT